jgi:histone H3/H4
MLKNGQAAKFCYHNGRKTICSENDIFPKLNFDGII